MCGRYNIVTDTDALLDAFAVMANELSGISGDESRYNIAPTSNVPIVHTRCGSRTLSMAHWGLLPHWAKDRKLAFKTFNARCETITDKPSFRGPIRRSRCIVPASGWFEWRKEGDVKQPYYFQTGQLIAFAGISTYHPTFELLSCSIITTAANPVSARIHARMPAILQRQNINDWMAVDTEIGNVLSLLRPYNGDDLAITKVSTKVNSTNYSDPDCIQRIE